MKRVLELENEIDEKNFSIESKEKEIEALSELLKVRMRLLLIGYWLRWCWRRWSRERWILS